MSVQLTVAGLQFCIALMGVSAPTDRECLLAWSNSYQGQCSKEKPCCAYLAGSYPNAAEAAAVRSRLMPSCENAENVQCFHFTSQPMFNGGIAKTYLCEEKAKPADDGPLVS